MKRRAFTTTSLTLLAAMLGASALPVRSAGPGVYVAVGFGGRRMSSADGIVWENVQQWAEKGGDDSNNLMSVAFGKGKFVAVGGGGWSRETQAGHILVSGDGKTWREVKKLPNRVNPVLFGEGRFLAGGPDKTLLWSDDGETWESGAKIDYPGWAFWFRHGAAGNGRFLFVGNAGPGQKEHWCAVSRDGKAIEAFRKDLPPVKGLAFGAGRFVLVGPNGLRMSSTDGKEWEHRADAPGEDLRGVVWTGKAFLAHGATGAYVSPDGITWTKSEQRIPCSVLWADERVHVGSSWPGQMWSSPDGGQWKKGAPLPPNGINRVVYGVPASGQ